jgi:hypothetical protein
LVLAALVVTLLLSACGSSSGGSTHTTAPPTSTASGRDASAPSACISAFHTLIIDNTTRTAGSWIKYFKGPGHTIVGDVADLSTAATPPHVCQLNFSVSNSDSYILAFRPGHPRFDGTPDAPHLRPDNTVTSQVLNVNIERDGVLAARRGPAVTPG